MENLNNLDFDISRILNNQDLGIISMDVGRLESGSDSWKPLERVCDQRVVGLHSKISELFKSVYQREPINYLFEHFINVGIEQDIYYQTFPILPADNQSYEDNYELVKDIDTNAKLLDDEEDYILNLFQADAGSDIYNNPTSSNFLSCFVQSQNVFSRAVGYLFNRRLGEKRLRYITIVLFAYKYDGVYHFTHSAAIFSDNEEYLKKDITGLIFENIRSGRYLDEVKSLQIKVKKESIKSAISAIMSRNMSHNLGSHYLYYTKAHLKDMARKAESFGPDIRGAAEVLGYIQGRMDYLATLISTDRYPYAPVNFKSQLFDDLTIDASSKRHFDSGRVNDRTTNFLLTNLILSENFTRPSITDNDEDNPFDMLRLQVKYKKDSTSSFETFTGTNNPNKYIFPSMSSEEGVKNALANLNIAMPGGTMSCHAFYNIIENFIRNSAKYRRRDFEKEERYIYDPETEDVKPDGKEHYNLNITIGIIKHQNGKYVDFVIYDNKANATYFKENRDDTTEKRCLLQILNDKLRSIKILTENNTIDKDSKGIKEMLFSAAWMRAYTFERSKTFADIISDIHAKPDGEAKLELINEHCFSFVAVNDSNDNLTIYTEKELLNNNCEISNKSPLNLGVSFTMPVFLDTAVLEGTDSEQDIINESLSLHADVAISEKHLDFLSNVYTRYYCGSIQNMSDVDILHSVIAQRFKDIDKYRLVFGTNSDKDAVLVSDAYVIKFEHHMNSKEVNILQDNFKYAYADTVSGGNFTKTINELFDKGNPKHINKKDNYEYLTPQDEYFALKIKESALTRITLIDERLSNDAAKRGNSYALELQLKNLSILNFEEHSEIHSILDLFGGIEFKDAKPFTHFLSIHLGILEKILKCREFNDYVLSKAPSIETTEDKAKFLMSEIKECFGGNDTYITIHSGRGNFSKELEGPLDSYPFISLSSIESALNNCKFLLSQLFYSTRYVGKGRYNKKQTNYE